MRRVLVFISLAIIGILMFGVPSGRAEIWTDLRGNAVDYATYICSPCCKVTNTHAARRLKVQIFLPLGPRSWTLDSYETVILTTPRGQCIRAALGMEANFAD
ncbi:MAG: hypothetical protein LCH39_05965 [Proteobacteria bacterium]|nr:hypothetical protein [Pseudomonadota bacterium]